MRVAGAADASGVDMAGAFGENMGAMVKVEANLKSSPSPLSIGQLAKRSGVAASALRFYEAEGLLSGSRSAGGLRARFLVVALCPAQEAPQALDDGHVVNYP